MSDLSDADNLSYWYAAKVSPARTSLMRANNRLRRLRNGLLLVTGIGLCRMADSVWRRNVLRTVGDASLVTVATALLGYELDRQTTIVQQWNDYERHLSRLVYDPLYRANHQAEYAMMSTDQEAAHATSQADVPAGESARAQ